MDCILGCSTTIFIEESAAFAVDTTAFSAAGAAALAPSSTIFTAGISAKNLRTSKSHKEEKEYEEKRCDSLFE